jgi:hypothetical protein
MSPENSANEQVVQDDANQGQQIQVRVAPELEYAYRDFFSIYVGMEEVVLELGNRHRAQPNQATIQNHIVLSVPNAVRLQQALGRSLEEARKRVQQQQQERQASQQQQAAAAKKTEKKN